MDEKPTSERVEDLEARLDGLQYALHLLLWTMLDEPRKRMEIIAKLQQYDQALARTEMHPAFLDSLRWLLATILEIETVDRPVSPSN